MNAGALGAQIGTHVNGANLDEEQFKPFFVKAAELNAFLLVHAVDCMAAHRLERHYATNLIGNPYESGSRSHRSYSAACKSNVRL